MSVINDRIRSFVERIERMNEEKTALSQDIKEVYSEAKGTGFDVKALRQVIKMRTWDQNDLSEHETLVQIYRDALEGTPLGDFAATKEDAQVQRH